MSSGGAPEIEPIEPVPTPAVAVAPTAKHHLPAWGWGLIVAGTAIVALVIGGVVGGVTGFGTGLLVGRHLPIRSGWTVYAPSTGQHLGGNGWPGAGSGSGGTGTFPFPGFGGGSNGSGIPGHGGGPGPGRHYAPTSPAASPQPQATPNS